MAAFIIFKLDSNPHPSKYNLLQQFESTTDSPTFKTKRKPIHTP
jgi:hypothetical protein